MIHTYYNPVRTCQGYGSLEKLPALAAEAVVPEKSILLLVWGESVLEKQGFKELQEQAGDRLIVRTFIASNPEVGQLFAMYQETKQYDIGLVIAVGGGSVLDVGKSLCCLYGREIGSVDALRELIAKKEYDTPVCRWIGIPTTAGTGSEVTCWATIWDSENHKKYSVDTQKNYAYAAVVDPQLADTMPLKLAVSSALDATAHAAESYWAKATNLVSRTYALEAICTIMGNIERLLKDPTDKIAHDAMAKGSMLAGMAFSNTRTTAGHSISYPLTMQCHIPHGVAVSLLIGPVTELNLPAVEDAEKLLAAFGVKTAKELKEKIESILLAAGHPIRLRQWGATEEMLPDLVAHSITKGRADNNPVELTETVVHNILKTIF